jgi:hypothetical protein
MSKSKKKSPPPAAQAPDAEHPKGALKDEDFIYVPRGKSRWTYIFILGLMVFTLITFVVPYGMSSLFGSRRGPGQTYMTWEHPRLGEREVSIQDFQEQQRELALFFHVLGQRDDSVYDDEATAAFLVTDALAEDAGVQFGARDLADFILQVFGTKERYQQYVGSVTTSANFEQVAQKVLRAQRYQQLITAAASPPTAEEIEKSWNERHEQFAFEAIGLAVEPLVETARSEATDEAALRAWYEALPPRSGAFAADWREAQYAAEQVGWPVDSADDPAGLLAAYPVPEGTDLAAQARQYYDAHFHTRFLKSEPTIAEDGQPSLYLSFEEVEAQALREAPIQRSLGLWRDALAARLAAGETVDLAAEAASMGLVYVPSDGPHPLAHWRGAPEPAESAETVGPPEAESSEGPAPFTGRFVEDGIRRADPVTGLVLRPVVERDALVVARVVERVEAHAAPFEEVRDKVAEEWAKERASELALEQLREARTALAPEDGPAGEPAVVTSEAFAAQAAALGTSVVRRDWFDPAAPLAPLASGVEESPLEAFTRRVARRLSLEEGQLSEPELDVEKTHAWLLRGAGRRPPPELDIEPREYQELLAFAGFEAQQAASELFSFERLQKLYGLHLARGTPVEGEQPPPEG